MNKGYFKKIVESSIIWTLALFFWDLLSQSQQERTDGQEPLSFVRLTILYVTLGIVSGVIFFITNKYLIGRFNKKFSFGKFMFFASIVDLLIFIVLIILGAHLYTFLDQDQFSWQIVYDFIISREGLILIFYLFLVLLLIEFVRQVDRKFGPGNLLRMLSGEFYRPKEVERIIMFLDLRSSTTIAEKIGHVAYSQFLQDCFSELGVVQKYEAEIYQYVGDEVVLVWEKSRGFHNSNCLQLYYDFEHNLQMKSDYFHEKYGTVPTFKAGCHVGPVVVAEVGQIKREIAYHGDTMNTASRIQGECNKQNQDLLISEDVVSGLNGQEGFEFSFMGNVHLRGRSQEMRIYGVKHADLSHRLTR